MKNIAPAMGLVAVLAGCAAPAPVVWVHPAKTAEDRTRDAAQCEYQATAQTQTADPSMRSAIGQGIDMGIRRANLFKLCMKAAGWQERQS